MRGRHLAWPAIGTDIDLSLVQHHSFGAILRLGNVQQRHGGMVAVTLNVVGAKKGQDKSERLQLGVPVMESLLALGSLMAFAASMAAIFLGSNHYYFVAAARK